MDDVTPELGNFLKYLAEGKATDKYTRKLVKAVETAKRNPRLMVEYMSYYADQADHRAALEESHAEGLEEGIAKGIEEGMEKGIAKGMEEGLAALVGTLKPILPDFEAVYAAVIRNQVYSDCTREKIEKYYRNVE